jgi:hypothetical protein
VGEQHSSSERAGRALALAAGASPELTLTSARSLSPAPVTEPAEEDGRRPSGRRRRARTSGLRGRERPIHRMSWLKEQLLVACLQAEAEVGEDSDSRRASRWNTWEAARLTLGTELEGPLRRRAERDGERTTRRCRIWSPRRETRPGRWGRPSAPRRHGRESSIFQEPSTTLDFILYIASDVLLVTCDGCMAHLVEGHQSYKHTARFQLMKSNCFVFFNHITVHCSI